MGPSWHPNRIQNRSQLRKADFAKNVEKHTKNHCFSRLWGSKLGTSARKFLTQALVLRKEGRQSAIDEHSFAEFSMVSLLCM